MVSGYPWLVYNQYLDHISSVVGAANAILAGPGFDSWCGCYLILMESI